MPVEGCLCLAGYWGPDCGQCTACGPGTFKAGNGSSECVACASGSYLKGVNDARQLRGLGDTTERGQGRWGMPCQW